MAAVGYKYNSSSADRWTTCTASVRDIAALPYRRDSDKYNTEGNAAHQLRDECMRARTSGSGHWHPDAWVGNDLSAPGEAWDGWTVKQDMATAVGESIEYMDAVVGGLLQDGWVVVTRLTECRFKIDYGNGVKSTAIIDELIVLKRAGVYRVVIADLKYGKGVHVDAKGNKQMVCYCIAVAQQMARWGIVPESYEAFVLMPRRNYYGSDTHTQREVQDYLTAFVQAIHESKVAPSYNPNEKACQWCDMRRRPGLVCRALTEDTYRKVAVKFVAHANQNPGDRAIQPEEFEPASTYTDHQLGVMFRDIANIKAWCSSVEKEAERRMKANPKGFEGLLKWVMGQQGNRAWESLTRGLEFMTGQLGLKREDAVNTVPISVTDAEKLVGKKAFTTAVATVPGIVQRSAAQPKLALWEAKGEPVSTETIAEKFGVQTNGDQ